MIRDDEKLSKTASKDPQPRQYHMNGFQVVFFDNVARFQVLQPHFPVGVCAKEGSP